MFRKDHCIKYQIHFYFYDLGLFHKGISQSGCVLNPWVLLEQPLEKTKKLSDYIGCPTNDNKLMVQCLRNKPARQIVDAVKYFQVSFEFISQYHLISLTMNYCYANSFHIVGIRPPLNWIRTNHSKGLKQ